MNYKVVSSYLVRNYSLNSQPVTVTLFSQMFLSPPTFSHDGGKAEACFKGGFDILFKMLWSIKHPYLKTLFKSFTQFYLLILNIFIPLLICVCLVCTRIVIVIYSNHNYIYATVDGFSISQMLILISQVWHHSVQTQNLCFLYFLPWMSLSLIPESAAVTVLLTYHSSQ